MNLINMNSLNSMTTYTYIYSIEEFNRTFDDSSITSFSYFITHRCSDEVLEYYIESYQDIYWTTISIYQPLSNDFICKYGGKLKWYSLFNNEMLDLTYDIIVKNIYHFNLYDIQLKLNKPKHISNKYIPFLDNLIKEFKDKYNIDKLAYEFNK